jgi:two-component system, LuxR family, response regulator FixJ
MTGERTVYVLDDDAAVCRSLERLLSSASFEPVTFQRPDEFLSRAVTFKKGCVLLDLRLPGTDGIEVMEALQGIRKDLPVIVMTAQGDIQVAVRAMKAGAVDFLEKPYSEQALLDAIEAAFASGGAFARAEEIADATRRVDSLSPREREVLEGLIDGHSNKVIAHQLGLSVRTIEVHRARMMDRLGMRQLAEALRLGIMARLGSRPSGLKG